MDDKPKVLFLCTGNACRSQMAEGLCRHFLDDRVEAFSAGIERHALNARAVRVMAEIGIDIAGHQSKTVDELVGQSFDYVVTVCDRAHETCPYFPAKTKVLHQGFDDPPKLADGAATEEEALSHYRRVRDEIRNFILELPQVVGLSDSAKTTNP
jgi:arsenate reductase